MSLHVLLVEDERKTAAFVARALRREGWETEVLHDGAEALEKLARQPFDAVVLDIMLPGRDGLSVVRQMRQRGLATAVLLLSARGAVEERVEGLNAGADDYLAKPFSIEELLARVRALGRRGTAGAVTRLEAGDLKMDAVRRTAERGGQALSLSPREFQLLLVLMQHAGRAVSREVLLEKGLGYRFDTETNLLDVYIGRLRRKVDAGFPVRLLRTEKGLGYGLFAS